MTNPWTPGPWLAEGFEQQVGHGDFYGGLILAADNETIVAQCVMENDKALIEAAPELADTLEKFVRTWDLLFPKLNNIDEAVEAEFGIVQIARVLLGRIGGEAT